MLRFYAWSSSLSAWQRRWWDAHSRPAMESFWMPTHSFTQGFKVFIVSFCACILPKQSEAAGSSQGLCNHHCPLVKEFPEMPLTRTVFYLHSILCHCSDLNHCNGIAHHRYLYPLACPCSHQIGEWCNSHIPFLGPISWGHFQNQVGEKWHTQKSNKRAVI